MIEEYVVALQKTQALINQVMEVDPELDCEELEQETLRALFEHWLERLDENDD